MKRLFLKSVLAVAGLFMANTAWADTTIGAIDKGWSESKIEFNLPANKTLSLNFVVNSTKKEQNYQGWVTQVNHNSDMIFFMQPSCGYAAGSWNWDQNTHIYNENNYEWEGTSFQDNLQGATVSYSVKRINSKIILTEDVTTSDNSKHFRHYFVYADTNATEDLKIVFGADNAILTITDVTEANVISDSEAPVLTGTLIGSEDNTTLWWTAFSDYFTIAPNESLSLTFKNYSNKIRFWNNWVTYVTTDADRGATGYTEYIGLRADNWETIQKGNSGISSNFNWATFSDDLDGATVTVTVTRTGASVKVRADIIPAAGGSYYEEFTKDCGDGTQNIRVFLTVEGAHIDLLPVTKTIGYAGWATLCSEYALDFTGAIDNLEAAYAITGHTGNTLTLAPINQVVAAGEGILLKGSGECKFSIKGSGTAVAGNLLKGVTANTVKDANSIYVLMDETNGVGFYKNNNAFTVGAGTAYLEASAVDAARSFFLLDGETTGISNATRSTNLNGEFYNLSGQRIAHPTKGLYIMNGKKVVIK